MRVNRRIDPTFAVELLLLALAAPALYFPGWFPAWAPYAAFGALVAGWVWRRWRLGVWYAPTPADWPIFFLFAVMLPVALWAAPGPLRQQYSIPRAYILLWNFCLFWTIVTHASRSRQSAEWALGGFALSALGIALVAPLGMNWLYKFHGAERALSAIPSPLLGVFQGAESGFHPNQVAGTLLYAFPLLLAITTADAIHRRRTLASRLVTWVVWVSTPVVGLALLLAQSRSALLGLIVGLAVMALLPWRRGRWALVVGVAVLLAAAPFAPLDLVDVIGGSPPAEALGGTSTLGFREDVWTQAIMGIYDFPFTGMGLNTFREVVFLLYPIGVNPTYNLGHAHNFFLQTALDFGVPGLIAVLAIYMTAVVVLYPPATRREEGVSPAAWGGRRVWALGLIGALVAQTVYSQLDAVTMGAKTNFMWWWMFGLVLSLSNLSLRLSEPRSTGFYAVSSESEELGFSRSGSASLRSE